MRTLKNYLSWLFALAATLCVPAALPYLKEIYRGSHGRPLVADLLVLTMFAIFATIFGMAWWTTWRGRRWARFWGIVASLINILLSAPIIILTRSFKGVSLLLAVGIAGVVAFWKRIEPSSVTAAQRHTRIAGDGTSNLVDKLYLVVVLVAGFGIWYWWERWTRANGIVTGGFDPSLGFMLTVAVLFVTAALHETAHAATGLALGMKIRGFVVAPFYWHIRDGRWEFEFRPTAILSGGGATGVVPATVNFPRWRYLCMLAAGCLVNLVTGSVSLWIAFTAEPGSHALRGFSALFGAWSLAVGAGNLLPFQSKHMYSDGARIYQFFSKGPLEELQAVLLAIQSSLVTQLRPRDFDIESILRVAQTFTHGPQALLLRLYAYYYFLDTGRIIEAEQALAEAESIYRQSAPDISAELHTEFVFGNAYVRRDAAGARDWWTRMETKKPTRFNADYWRAYSALHWIEGNLNEANDAWEKSNKLAKELPKTGAYEFDRYRCALLREALDKASALAPH